MTSGAQPNDVITDSQQQWLAMRSRLKERRRQLAAQAGTLYPDVLRIEGTELLCRAGWVPAAQIELDQMVVRWIEPAPAAAITGSSPESALVRPLTDAAERFAMYADAVEALDRPALFENRPIYRLVDADLHDASGVRLDLASGRYFDAISVAEALAHEFATAARDDGEAIAPDRLPLRVAVGDPLDLSRRPVSVAITTLTLRRTRPGEASFLLHWRDPASVTHAGGMYQVMPVGIFQPADDAPASVHHDLNLWHNMVREFSEELLGAPEDYGQLGSPIPYERWGLYQRMSDARRTERLRVSILGVGVDPLTLVADILAVAVFDAELFDEVFSGLVEFNSEGRILSDGHTTGFAFTEASVDRFSRRRSMQAAGAAVLRLTWKHRRSLLS